MRAPRLSTNEAVARLRTHLSGAGLGPQDQLDPERQLAPRIGCSRSTLRAALDVLEREGRIWRHVGQGTFIGPRPSRGPIKPKVLIDLATPAEVLDARLLIEPPIAGAAALRASAEEIALLRHYALRSSEALDWQAYEQADADFHSGIARATANPVVIAFLDLLSSMRGRARWQREHDLIFRRARKQEYAARQGRIHLAIVEAIAARDSEAASGMMLSHLTTIRALMLRNDPD